MIKIKRGVTPRNLYIMAAAANVAEMLGVEVVITSGTDGKHMKGSKHYTSEALDIRTKTLSREKKFALLDGILARLGTNYQGILESEDKVNEHIHVEYDPQ